jgi:hypothetical protein
MHVCEGQKIQHQVKVQRGFKKGDMHVFIVIIIELMTIMSSNHCF